MTDPAPHDRSTRFDSPRRGGPTSGPLAVAGALLLDAGLTLLFVALGQGQHSSGDGPLGLIRTASPFLVALAAMTAVTAGHRTWARVWPHGVVVWLGTVALGMVLRVWWGLGGAPTSFVLVSAGVLAVFLLGRRLLSALLVARAGRRP